MSRLVVVNETSFKTSIKNVYGNVYYQIIVKRAVGDSVKNDQIINTSVSYYGSWNRRGHSSLNSVGTTISMPTGKILDVKPLRRSCKACSLKKHLKKVIPLHMNNGKTVIHEILNGIKVRVFSGKNIERSFCAIMIRTIITFVNQIFL